MTTFERGLVEIHQGTRTSVSRESPVLSVMTLRMLALTAAPRGFRLPAERRKPFGADYGFALAGAALDAAFVALPSITVFQVVPPSSDMSNFMV